MNAKNKYLHYLLILKYAEISLARSQLINFYNFFKLFTFFNTQHYFSPERSSITIFLVSKKKGTHIRIKNVEWIFLKNTVQAVHPHTQRQLSWWGLSNYNNTMRHMLIEKNFSSY